MLEIYALSMLLCVFTLQHNNHALGIKPEAGKTIANNNTHTSCERLVCPQVSVRKSRQHFSSVFTFPEPIQS